MMMTHSFVPDDFGSGVIIPIIKDRNGDTSSIENYRPITLSPVLSKIFEAVLLDKFASSMTSDDLQFDFKKNLECSNAIFVFRQVIDFFIQRGSTVHVASLDASKAFDLLNHLTLFTTLIKRGVPKIFINVIINWYQKLTGIVRWNDQESDVMSIVSGVRQGGLLSSLLFNVYVDVMINSLRKLGCGCHLKNNVVI